MSDKNKSIRRLVHEIVEQRLTDQTFVPGETFIPYGGRVYDEQEVIAAVESSIDFWLTLGEQGVEFERKLAQRIGRRGSILVNSGSSANLVAFAALCSPHIENPIAPGDEVITVAAGFPTTLNPIVQYRAVPVFVDIDPHTLNIDTQQLEEALSPRTRAVMIAHTLGNPFDVNTLLPFCNEHDLILIEDNCDALGSRYKDQLTGSFGLVATQSFYPPHHLTMGEGGAILFDSPKIKRRLNSIRDWGKDCWCPAGKDNTCGTRFSAQHGQLPIGYDHKYVFSEIGYNLKPLEIQAAIGLVQLDRLDDFTSRRRHNWDALQRVAASNPWLSLQQPTTDSEPSWFGFALTLTADAPVDRCTVVNYFENHKIQTRQLFAGNLLRQPAYRNIPHRTIDSLEHSDHVMRNNLFIGVYPGIDQQRLDYMSEHLDAIKKLERRSPRLSRQNEAQQPSPHVTMTTPKLHPIVEEDLEQIVQSSEAYLDRLRGSHYVITGATGIIGSYLAAALGWMSHTKLEGSLKVTALSRSRPDTNHLLNPFLDSNLIQHCEADARFIPNHVDPADYLALFATQGAPRAYLQEQLMTLELNSSGLERWLQWASQHRCRGVLYASSGEIYGTPPDNQVPTPEHFTPTADHLSERSIYAEAKRFGETLCLTYQRSQNLPVVIARPFQIFGPSIQANDSRALPDFIHAVLDNRNIELQSAGTAQRTFLYVADAICAFLAMQLSAASGTIYNVGSQGPELTILELAQSIAEIGKTECGYTGEVKVLAKEAGSGQAPQRTCPDVSALTKATGWKPHSSINDIIQRTLRFNKQT